MNLLCASLGHPSLADDEDNTMHRSLAMAVHLCRFNSIIARPATAFMRARSVGLLRLVYLAVLLRTYMYMVTL